MQQRGLIQKSYRFSTILCRSEDLDGKGPMAQRHLEFFVSSFYACVAKFAKKQQQKCIRKQEMKKFDDEQACQMHHNVLSQSAKNN